MPFSKIVVPPQEVSELLNNGSSIRNFIGICIDLQEKFQTFKTSFSKEFTSSYKNLFLHLTNVIPIGNELYSSYRKFPNEH